MSGHSKWAQIKHKKAVTDARKGQLFSKLVREIMVAVRYGGENPDFNARLRTAVERARAEGLPKENVARAIARATGGGDAEVLQEFLYEALAPGGVLILVAGITDNKNRTIAEIKKLLTARGARLADPGSVLWNFEKIGSLEIRKEDNPEKSAENIELAIVESGAENFDAAGLGWLVTAKFPELDHVRTALEEFGIHLYAVVPSFRPRAPLARDESAHTAIEPLLAALADQDDVQEIYTNIND